MKEKWKKKKQRNQEQEIVDAIGVMGSPHLNYALGPAAVALIVSIPFLQFKKKRIKQLGLP